MSDRRKADRPTAGVGSDFFQEAGEGSEFFGGSRQETWRSISAFMLLLTGLIVLVSLTFGWSWIPVVLVAWLAGSAALAIRSRMLGRATAYYEESVYLTTVTFGVLGAAVLLVGAIR